MKLADALFNWLQMKHVAEVRPDDQAAQETYSFFERMLKEDFKLENIEVKMEDSMYTVYFVLEGEEQEKQFPASSVHQLLHDIEGHDIEGTDRV